jgi:hypothetical protein
MEHTVVTLDASGSEPKKVLPVRKPRNAAKASLAAGCMILLVVGGIGAMGWAVFGGDKLSGDEEIVESGVAIARGNGGMNMGRRMVMQQRPAVNVAVSSGILKTGDTYTIRSGNATMVAFKPAPTAAWGARFTYDQNDIITQDQQQILLARWRIARDPAVAKALNISDDQKKKLEAIPGGNATMVVDDAGRKKMLDLWAAYDAAAADKKAPAEAALKAGLADLAKSALEPTKKQVADRVTAVKTTLTPQQLEQFLKMGRGG